MKRRFGVGLAAFALAGMIVAGAAASAFAEPLSNNEFKKQANAICAEGNKQIDAAAEQAFAGLTKGQQPSADQLTAFAGVALPLVKQQIDGVAALDAPKSLKSKVKQLIRSARAGVAKAEANPALLADVKHNPFAASDKQAKKLGLKACAASNS
jgi:hypothetical protein